MTIKKNILVLVFYTLLTLLVTWPLILHLNTLIIDKYDGLLITWIINWDIHSMTNGWSGITNFFQANIFYPDKYTLAFSDLQLPLAIIALPLVLLTYEPLIAFNINFLVGFILTAFSVYILTKRVVGSPRVGVVAGLLFSFSTIHLNYMTHLQLFNFWPVVFALYFLIGRKWGWYIFFFVIAGLLTPLNIFFISTVAVLKKGLKATIFGMVILTPFLLPYYLVSSHYHYVRPITDAIHFSLSFQDLLNISNASRLAYLIGPTTMGTPAYIGGTLVVLLLINLSKRKYDFWLILAGVSLILALGPALHLIPTTVHIGPFRAIPLPYTVLYYLVPGFSGFRTPSRWIILAVLAVVVYVSKNLKGIPIWQLSVIGLAIILEINWPFGYQQLLPHSEFPEAQKWLVDNFAGAPIVEFPIYGWWDSAGLDRETNREYWSTIHWHPMYNGYSGFSPRDWEDSVKWLQKDCPSKECIDYLRSKGIKLVVDDQKRIWPLKLIHEFPSVSIFEIQS